jgi:6-methylsalicylate decarboxylase
MTTVDFHQHLWPPALIEALQKRTSPPRLDGGLLLLPSGEWPVDLGAHDLDARLLALDRDEIDVAVVSCPATLELDDELVEAYHEGVLELVEAAGGRLRALACHGVRDGFVGVCVPAPELADLDALAPLLGELQARGDVLFVHPGAEAGPTGMPGWWTPVVGYTAQMQSAYAHWLVRGAEEWPELRVVFAILAGGAPIQLERLASRGIDTRTVLHDNVFFDTASYGERALELALATFGVNQIVYGSDRPVVDAEPTLRAVRGFGQAVADAVCRDNPTRLLT